MFHNEIEVRKSTVRLQKKVAIQAMNCEIIIHPFLNEYYSANSSFYLAVAIFVFNMYLSKENNIFRRLGCIS